MAPLAAVQVGTIADAASTTRWRHRAMAATRVALVAPCWLRFQRVHGLLRGEPGRLGATK